MAEDVVTLPHPFKQQRPGSLVDPQKPTVIAGIGKQVGPLLSGDNFDEPGMGIVGIG
jgi:hypothetical protein